jgi:CheY-like chemotaxis protein
MTAGSLRVFIVDDSSTALNHTKLLLELAGHEAEGLTEPELAIQSLREFDPDLIILDIMMPGVNGFELCRLIRQDKNFKDVPIVMSSAKAYEADRNRARQLGADGYIVKPFTLEKFDSIAPWLFSMQLSAWGVRGTLPMGQEGYIRFGGHTSCYSLQVSPDHYLVLDAGTGIKNLGTELLKAGHKRITADILITHPHWDHIHGFPFFTPLYIPGNVVNVYGAAQGEKGIEELMLAQMDGTHFPVTVREFGALVSFHEIGEQEMEFDGVRVRSFLLKHPGHCLGYRVDYRDRSFCYITDNELYPADSDYADEEFIHRLTDFCRGANVLVHDCTYFDQEYATRLHWGHSSLSEVCRLAHLAEVERLWIHHHDPDQPDDEIERKLEFCTEALAAFGAKTRAVLPKEGTNEFV